MTSVQSPAPARAQPWVVTPHQRRLLDVIGQAQRINRVEWMRRSRLGHEPFFAALAGLESAGRVAFVNDHGADHKGKRPELRAWALVEVAA